jgi:hypothetical protein
MADLDGVVADVRLAFRDPEPALSSLGVEPWALPKSHRKPPLSAATPWETRVARLDEVLRSHLRLLADSVAEFDNEHDLTRLEGEALAVVISLRELS